MTSVVATAVNLVTVIARPAARAFESASVVPVFAESASVAPVFAGSASVAPVSVDPDGPALAAAAPAVPVSLAIR